MIPHFVVHAEHWHNIDHLWLQLWLRCPSVIFSLVVSQLVTTCAREQEITRVNRGQVQLACPQVSVSRHHHRRHHHHGHASKKGWRKDGARMPSSGKDGSVCLASEAMGE